jgi:diguanylate cyclase (GGDEF)-like protein
MDLNGFKEINDQYGHLAGDKVLQVVSQRIRATLRASDTVARLGGDEFAFVLPTVDGDVPELVAKKIIATLDEAIDVDNGPLKISGSIGIALYPGHAIDNDGLFAKADAAMYEAKRTGGGVCVHQDEEAAGSVSGP